MHPNDPEQKNQQESAWCPAPVNDSNENREITRQQDWIILPVPECASPSPANQNSRPIRSKTPQNRAVVLLVGLCLVSPDILHSGDIIEGRKSIDSNHAEPDRISATSDRIGGDELTPDCAIRFIEDGRMIVMTSDQHPQVGLGAKRVGVAVDALDLAAATLGETLGGDFKGAVPVSIPLKNGHRMKIESWVPIRENFSWALPPTQSTLSNSPFWFKAGNREKAQKMLVTLRGIQGTSTSVKNDRNQEMRKLLLGKWLERKIFTFYPNETWAIQRHEQAPLDTAGRLWELEGDKLKLTFLDGVVTDTVVAIDSKQMILLDSDKVRHVYQRVSGSSDGIPTGNQSTHVPQGLSAFPIVFEMVWSGRTLAKSACDGLGPWQIKVLRNAVFARHGRVYESAKLSGLFHRCRGYNPDRDYSDNRLTLTDQENIKVIKTAEVGAKRPSPDSPENALRAFIDALASGDIPGIQSLCNPSIPVTLVVLDPGPPRKITSEKQLPADSKQLTDLWTDDGMNGEGYSLMMTLLWDFTLSPRQDGHGVFSSKSGGTEIRFAEKDGKWWLTGITDTAP